MARPDLRSTVQAALTWIAFQVRVSELTGSSTGDRLIIRGATMNSVRFDPQGPFMRDPLAPHQMRNRLTRTEDVFCSATSAFRILNAINGR